MKQPDMAFLGSEFPEPGMQPAAERYEVHPATQHLHDTGFGPIAEFGDEPVQGKDEWRVWVMLVALNGLLGVCVYHVCKWTGLL